MKSLSKKIIIGYLTFILLYFIFAYVFFEPSSKNAKNIIEAILTSFGDLLHWIIVIAIFLFIMLGSAIVGMIVFRKNRSGFITFRIIAIVSGVLIVAGIIMSYF